MRTRQRLAEILITVNPNAPGVGKIWGAWANQIGQFLKGEMEIDVITLDALWFCLHDGQQTLSEHVRELLEEAFHYLGQEQLLVVGQQIMDDAKARKARR